MGYHTTGALASTTFPRFIVSESVPARSFPPRSPDAFPPRPSFLYLSFRTYSVFPSPRPIYLPPRVAEWILFVSHRYFSGPACRSPSKTVSPPRFMFPPTQRRIDPFLLSDVYVCGGASFTLSHPQPPDPPSLRPARYARAQISRTRLTIPARHAVDGLLLLVPSLCLLLRLLFSGSVTLPRPFRSPFFL